jgi:hypothetical protein
MNDLALKLYQTTLVAPRVSGQNTNNQANSERRPLTYSEAKEARIIDANNKGLKELLAKKKVRNLNAFAKGPIDKLQIMK